jgi:hypothetical protein
MRVWQKTPIILAIITGFWLLVINTGEFNWDTSLRLQISHSLWTGEAEIDPQNQPIRRGDQAAGVLGKDGKRVIGLWDIGQSLIMVPGDWLGTQVQPFFPRIDSVSLRQLITSYVIFIPLNICLVLAVYRLLLVFQFTDRIAGLSTLLWFFGTTVLHYAQNAAQNNQILLLAVISYTSCLIYFDRNKSQSAIISGLAGGGLILFRITAVIHLAILFLFAGISSWIKSHNSSLMISFVRGFLLGFIPLFIVGRILDYWRLGSPFLTPQSVWQQSLKGDPIWSTFPLFPDNYPFTNFPLTGIVGVLFSPAKSLFLYDPLLIPCLILAWMYWSRMSSLMKAYVFSCLIDLVLHILITSRWDFWHADAAWAARYHVTSVHLLLIPLVAIFMQQLLVFRGWRRWGMQVIIMLSLVVQMASISMIYGLEFVQDQIGLSEAEKGFFGVNSRQGFRLGQRFVNLACLVNSSVSPNCIPQIPNPQLRRSLMSYHRIEWVPAKFAKFYLNRKYTYLFWGLASIVAIASTILYLFLPHYLRLPMTHA